MMRHSERSPVRRLPSLFLTSLLALGLAVPATSQSIAGTGRRGPAPKQLGERASAAIRRINVSSSGWQANGTTDVCAVSGNGRFVAFSSLATNLTPGDPAGIRDVFVTDTDTGATTLVSVSTSGQPGNAASGTELSISADGRFVAFDSWASDLVTGDSNGQLDIFVHDRLSGVTELVSASSAGVLGNGPSAGASLSADGRFVAFSSWADNLVTGDVNGLQDVFLHDRWNGTTKRISQTNAGIGGIGESFSPFLSSNGLFVAYVTKANNLVTQPLDIYYYIFVSNTQTGATWHASVDSFGEHAHGDCFSPSVTHDGRFVSFSTYAYNLDPLDWNGVNDVFVHDHLTGQTTRVSLSVNGVEGNGGSVLPTLSEDGTQIAFMSSADNLVPGDQNGSDDVFLKDLVTGQVRRISRAVFGGVTGSSTTPTLSADGRRMVFSSDASNLVRGDTNGLRDIFLSPVP